MHRSSMAREQPPRGGGLEDRTRANAILYDAIDNLARLDTGWSNQVPYTFSHTTIYR